MALEPMEVRSTSRTGRDYDFRYCCYYDLLSFFYVFLTGCVEYGRDPGLPELNLNSWCSIDMEYNIRNKKNDIELNFRNFINNKFSNSFIDAKELAIELQKELFGKRSYYYRHSRHEDFMYNNIIMAFNRTIGQIEAGKIPNRTWTN
ncbi:Bgt-50326 [Blumeria graminis f. sp. tritici]|uniref:Bgt-50326 n=2 Tax=Blumeria graminis TaxID=34373 RepID=A0A9X9QBF3_BLUGR|nr:Bgt-50326 [Blumeria graminis f. sp. tritici]